MGVSPQHLRRFCPVEGHQLSIFSRQHLLVSPDIRLKVCQHSRVAGMVDAYLGQTQERYQKSLALHIYAV